MLQRGGLKKKMRRGWSAIALVASTSAAATAWAQDAASSAAPPASPATVASAAPQVAEVIVTARKREERLEDVPIAITALSGAKFAEGQHLRIEELNQFAPSTNIVIPSPHSTSFAIRGIGSNPGNDGLQQSAGIFLDGVYLGRQGMANMDLIDIDQIEELRGPQGTLYGKNTTAGALNITTAAPSFTPSGVAQIAYGNYNYTQLQGMATGPLWGDQLAGRITAYKTLRDGDVTDVTDGRKLNSIDREGVRAQLLYQPNSRFRLRLIGEYDYESDSSGTSVLNSLGATPAALQKDLSAAGASVVADPTGLSTAQDGPMITHTRQAAVSAQADWDLGYLTLTSITAYRNWFYSSDADIETSNKSVANGGYANRDDQFSEELRVATPKDRPIEAVAGAYYFQQDFKVDQLTWYGNEAAAYLSGVPDALLPAYAKASPALAALVAYNNSRWDVLSTPTTHSYALFGQATWHITPQWSVTGGARETYETESETVSRPNPISIATGQPVAALASQAYAPHSVGVADGAPSGLLSLDYRFRPDVMLYASASRGEKAGGVNSTVPSTLGLDSLKVKPEVATSFELGVKSQFFEHRLQLNADVFDTHVQDYQASYIETPPGGGTAVQILTNVGMVRTQGVEVEAAVAPVAGLTLNGNASYNDAIYLSYPAGPCPAGVTGQTSCDLSGRPVAGAPRWIINLNGEYQHELVPGFQGFVGGEYSWRSDYFGYLDESPFARIGAFGIVNAHLGVRFLHGWEASLWGRNLADKHYVAEYMNYGALLPGVYVPFFGDPRTYGLMLRAAF